MIKLKDILIKAKDNSQFLSWIWFIVKQPKCLLEENRIKKEIRLRTNGYLDKRFQLLLSYKNKYVGQRCFIVATGPSLTISDIECLNGEITFGMNSIIKLYDKTSWRPTFYGIQDSNVYQKLQPEILAVYRGASNIFVSDNIANKYETHDSFCLFPYDAVYHDNYLEIDKYFSMFSADCYRIVYDGYSITYSLIQIAVYMGFKEIYLLGVDCSYKRGAKNHIVESGNNDKNEEKNHEKMMTGYIEAKKYADKNGIKIINCTRGGMLEVFPRMTLDEVLNNK